MVEVNIDSDVLPLDSVSDVMFSFSVFTVSFSVMMVSVSDVVVPLPRVHVALGLGPNVGVVQDNAHDEHQHSPSNTAVHSLRSVLILRDIIK